MRRDSAVSIFRLDRNPLQLSVTAKTTREVPADQSGHLFTADGNEGGPRLSGMPRVQLAREISANAGLPKIRSAPVGGADIRHGGDVAVAG